MFCSELWKNIWYDIYFCGIYSVEGEVDMVGLYKYVYKVLYMLC